MALEFASWYAVKRALMHAGYDPAQTAPGVDVALSAATAIINRQMKGFAYLPIP